MPKLKESPGLNAELSLHAGIVSGHSALEIEELHRALFDRARGVRVLIHEPTSAMKSRCEVLRHVLIGGDEYDETYVYQFPPCPQSLKIIIENNIGRAGTRQLEAPDPVIQVLTAVPTQLERMQVEAQEDEGFSDLEKPSNLAIDEVAAEELDTFMTGELGALSSFDVDIAPEDLSWEQ